MHRHCSQRIGNRAVVSCNVETGDNTKVGLKLQYPVPRSKRTTDEIIKNVEPGFQYAMPKTESSNYLQFPEKY